MSLTRAGGRRPAGKGRRRPGRPFPAPCLPSGLPAGDRGAAAALVVLFLPCLIACAALAADLGALLIARAEMRAAADMGALAGVQDLDYVALAEGEVLIVPENARADAEAWVRANLEDLTLIEQGSLEVVVTVINLSDDRAPSCPVTGRRVRYPTVCVLVRALVRLPFTVSLGPVHVSVHADAAVVGRP